MTKLVLQEEEEEEEKEGDEDAENTDTVEVPPQKKAKVTMSVLCVENGVLGGPKRGRSPKLMYMTNLLLAFSEDRGKLRKRPREKGGCRTERGGPR